MINGSICMSFHRFQNGNSVLCSGTAMLSTYLLFPRPDKIHRELATAQSSVGIPQITNKFLHVCFCNQNVCLVFV